MAAVIEVENLVKRYNELLALDYFNLTIEEGEVFGTLTSSIKNEGISCTTKEDTEITIIEYNQITNDEIIKSDFYIIFIKNLIKMVHLALNLRKSMN